MFRWLRSENRERRKKLRLDRQHLEARSRRFLNNYLEADEARKPRFYRAVEEASGQCHPTGLPADREDAEIAEATSSAAMKIVLDRVGSKQDDRSGDFITDAYATVAVAYHRAAGVYITDPDMQELGTAAVHLLTMATSFVGAHKEEGT
jgi:hypothetical protein